MKRPVLRTDRLIVRPFESADLPQFRNLLEMPEVPGWQMQRDRAEAFLDWHIANAARLDIVHGLVCLAIVSAVDGTILGSVGAGEHDDLHETELFYNILPGARGKGYATEAASAVIDWVFSDTSVPFLVGTAGVDNVASQRVLEKCGFERMETRKLMVHVLGERHEFRCYRLTNPSHRPDQRAAAIHEEESRAHLR